MKELSKNTNYLEQHTYNNLNVIENIPVTSSSSKVDDFSILNDKEEKVLVCSIPNPTPPAIDADFVETTMENCDNTNTLPDAFSSHTGNLDFERYFFSYLFFCSLLMLSL